MGKKAQLALATALVFWLVWLGSHGKLAAFIDLAAKPDQSK